MSHNLNSEEPGFNLDRFLIAQNNVYEIALAEIRKGRKVTHWMWYIFPQLTGLGMSSTSQFYGIKGIDEAKAYLSHKVLGTRLLEITKALISLNGLSALEIFGRPDDTKLKSCMTLFAQISDGSSVFYQVIEQYFEGKSDIRTINMLGPLVK